MAPDKEITKDLTKKLSTSGIEKHHLDELVKVIAGLQQQGMSKFRLFPRGIPYDPEAGFETSRSTILHSTGFSGIAEKDALAAVIQHLQFTPINWGKIIVHPIGVPVIDGYSIAVELQA